MYCTCHECSSMPPSYHRSEPVQPVWRASCMAVDYIHDKIMSRFCWCRCGDALPLSVMIVLVPGQQLRHTIIRRQVSSRPPRSCLRFHPTSRPCSGRQQAFNGYSPAPVTNSSTIAMSSTNGVPSVPCLGGKEKPQRLQTLKHLDDQ